ncbi:unnamed protein product, partial [Sphagnum jensenii]
EQGNTGDTEHGTPGGSVDPEDEDEEGREVEGGEDFQGFELEDDDGFLELGSEVDEEEFVDYEDHDEEEDEDEEDEDEDE